ncbi:protein SUPPRESSOR OF GENE SILENCING 3 [Argentina anserina]|uniref:protein SUPPRESSOR OF GENE SILENCING 3 n=1 Tax=Argentina anserina TaxID=57926 RepID=UPI00217625A4|nr:protein SUPPRESSOR OF GENE SILENCING 3 [Potentilla anserina]XP_050364369.1 protein SUPPRESSOR OF GENE SILENCING 3 [Potentilla anserina]
MSSSRGGGNPKGKHVSQVNSPGVEQLSQDVGEINLGSTEDDGNWEEVIGRKSKNRAGSTTAKAWGSPSSASKSWGQQDAQKPNNMQRSIGGGSGRAAGKSSWAQAAEYRKPAGRGNGRQQSAARNYDNSSVTPQHAIPPPLNHGWNWQSRAGLTQPKEDNDAAPVDDDADELSDADADSDDDFSDEFDSDASVKSHETRKKNRLLKKFFEVLDSLTIEEINEPGRQWHCPACQNGPGAIDWYRGLQPLMTHAKTKGSIRARLHRELAELLDEELRRRGTTVVPAGESFGKWKGLTVEEKDHEIVWPPMVVIMNTKLEQDDNDKWIGMGNQELLDYFSSYSAVRARHSYGPHGHRGMSLLIFEASARGYFEAERLHRHFIEQRTDRDAWHRASRALFHSGGQRQLYGYMAMKDDMEIFNQHSQGKSKLKFEMRSYQEKVVNDLRQMSEDNQQLIWLKNRVVKEQRHAKALEESLGIVSEKLRKTAKDNRIVIQKTQTQQEETQEEMRAQEEFFKEQIRIIHESRDAKEEGFERLQQEQREKVKQSHGQPALDGSDEIANFIKVQDKEMEDFVAEREMLIKVHGENQAAMKRRHWEEEVALEKEFNDKLTQLMDKYSKVQPEAAATLRGEM